MAIKKSSFPYNAPWSNADLSLLCLETGTWRTNRPLMDYEKCNYCGICSMYCPPQCLIDKGDHFEPNLTYCKGCGICAKECPRKAVTMVSEKP
jgi:2-oxoacid:acceptor oxidoreductase delta subunit (pyruvate/2-ketoisovalerate family)